MARKSEKKQRVALTTLGCKVNQFESASFQTGFTDNGLEVVPFSNQADIYVVNTCAVTAKAAAQSRQMIRRAIKANPKARVVITGCYAQVASKDILALSDKPVCIVGNGYKDQLVSLALARDCCDLEMFMGDISRRKEISPLPVRQFPDRTRAFLKIQDGCNRFCSYCIVPYARGRSRSLAPAEVLNLARGFIEQGYKELVLTGIHIGMYGQDLPEKTNLTGLLTLLNAEVADVRFRISSLESAEISDDLLDLLADTKKIVPHLHIPLQSGDDGVLARMNRPYTAKDFARTVEKCLTRLPDLCIGTDVMAGFPGETGQALTNSLKLLEDLSVAYLHVFPYSKRPGTKAAEMKNQVHGLEKEARVARLKELDHKKRTAFYGRYIGKTRPVLTENSKNRFRLMKGFTDNYIPVHFQAAENKTNQILAVRIERLVDLNVFGSLDPDDQGTTAEKTSFHPETPFIREP